MQPVHWTYNNFSEDDDLQQGDIIERSPEIIQILDEAHKHFVNDKYSAFIILSQSCDLVRRDGKPCSARYINLAVIRSLESMLPSLLNSVCECGKIGSLTCDNFYTKESKEKANQLIERILNQNEFKTGLFYLHPDADAGIAVPSVVLLQVGIALRKERYEALRKSRCGRLKEEFQHKLGWLYGHIFSRVGVKDWDDDRKKSMTKDLLNDFGWISAGAFETATKKGIAIQGVPHHELKETLSALEKAPPMEMAIKRTAEAIKTTIPEISQDSLNKITDALKLDPVYINVIRQKS